MEPTSQRKRAFGAPDGFWFGRMAVLALTLSLSTLVRAEPIPECDHFRLTVFGTAEERRSACDAIAAVLRYFADGGIAIELELTVRFQRMVYVELTNTVTSAITPLPVSAHYRGRENEIRMVSFDSEWKYHRRPWHLQWNNELAVSILHHEIVHAVVKRLAGNRSHKLPPPWHEALAYAVQLDLMDPDLRSRVLAQYPEQEAFATTLHINDFVYGADPDAFAIAAYKTYVKYGKLNFLMKAIAFKLETIDLREFLP